MNGYQANEAEKCYKNSKNHDDDDDDDDDHDSDGDSGDDHDDVVGAEIGSRPTEWGTTLGRDGDSEIYVREFPDGSKVLTHVLWAPE